MKQMTRMTANVFPTTQLTIPPNIGGGGFLAGFAYCLNQGL